MVLIIIKFSSCSVMLRLSILFTALKNPSHHLNRDHLALLLRVRNALIVLPSLKGKLLLVALLLLLDKRFYELVPFHLLRILKSWRLSLLLLSQAREKSSDRLLVHVHACKALFHITTLTTAQLALIRTFHADFVNKLILDGLTG